MSTVRCATFVRNVGDKPPKMWEAYFERVGSALSLPVDYAKLASCLVFSFILSPVLPNLPRAWMRHVMNIGVSAWFLLGILQLYTGVIHLVVACLATYFAVYFRIGGKAYMPWIVFVGCMAHMLYSHCARELNHVPLTTIEISAMHMVLVMNLTSFAWSCWDGQLRTLEECDDVQKVERVTQMPNLLEFFGYCFYFPGVMVGPSTRFHDYLRWANGSMYGPRTTPPPGRWVESLREVGIAVVSLILMTSTSAKFDYNRLIDPTDTVVYMPLWRRILFVQVAGLVVRFRFYGVWSLSNAGCVLSGLAFNGTDPATHKATWTRCKNVFVRHLEGAHNWKELLDAWNSNTNVWLRESVYKRLAGHKKPGFFAFMGTFLTSAIWHGIAPGYYLTFVTAALAQWLARMLRKSVRPIFYANTRDQDPTWKNMSRYTLMQNVYASVSNMLTISSVNYTVSSFFVLSLHGSLAAYRSVAWHYHILILGGLLAFQLGAGKALRPLHIKAPKSKAT